MSPSMLTTRFAAALLAGLCGCSEFNRHREDLQAMRDAGDLLAAEQALQSERADRLYGENNEVLLSMDLGAVYLAKGSFEQSFRELNVADDLDESLRKAELGETLSGVFLGENTTQYRPPAYESMYINVLKMIDQFALGRVSGGATVEARRLALKANLLRDEHLRLMTQIDEEDIEGLQRRLDEESGANELQLGPGGPVLENESEEFIESTLGLYLSAVAFMAEGDRASQEVAGRRLMQAFALQEPLIGPVDAAAFESIGTIDRVDSNGLVVALSGTCPTRRPLRIGPILVYDVPVYFELPILEPGHSAVASARVVAQPVESAEPEIAASLDLVERVAQVAEINYERELPVIYTRTLLRAVAKSAALTTANIAVHNATDDFWTRAAVAIGGLVLLAYTEPADLRCWLFLPGQAHVGLLRLEPGEYDLYVEYLDGAGNVFERSVSRRMTFSHDTFETFVSTTWR